MKVQFLVLFCTIQKSSPWMLRAKHHVCYEPTVCVCVVYAVTEYAH